MICHPKTPCLAVQMLQATAELNTNGSLKLSYILKAQLEDLIIPKKQRASFVDGLWENTCFEAFICVEGARTYYEYNFSPSTQWAAYGFGDYRKRLEWSASEQPIIRVNQSDNQLRIDAIVAACDLPDRLDNKPLQLGLTAVIEAADGSKSYWALEHPLESPDFHHKDGFILVL